MKKRECKIFCVNEKFHIKRKTFSGEKKVTTTNPKKEVFPMHLFTTEIVDAEYKKQDIIEIFCSDLEMSVNPLFATVLTDFLYYENIIVMIFT